MCFFPRPNPNTESQAYALGVTSFNCGVCPECLRKKSNYWTLRCCMEAKVSSAVMVTLTYDSYVYDSYGNIIGERLPDDMKVHKRDVQLFMKRLRRHFSYHNKSNNIKYLAVAEYGSRTKRPHYHCILFNVPFDDLVYYKKSKRGNIIYKSPTLTKLWKNGICTVDSVACSSAIARYCTKYMHKDKGADDDTFMLFSQGIGDKMLLKEFNGKSYYVDGIEYPIPRTIFKKVLEPRVKEYNSNLFNFVYGYSVYKAIKNNTLYELKPILDDFNKLKLKSKYCRKKDKLCLYPTADSPTLLEISYFNQRNIDNIQRQNYLAWKLKQPDYLAYLNYWKNKISMFRKTSTFDKVSSLSSVDYWTYKNDCYKMLPYSNNTDNKFYPRQSNKSLVNAFSNRNIMMKVDIPKVIFRKMQLAVISSRLLTASDTKLLVVRNQKFVDSNGEYRVKMVRDSKTGRFLEKSTYKTFISYKKYIFL